MNRSFSALSCMILHIGVVMLLYLAHALPLYFYNVALPAILRDQGVDLSWIGLLAFIYLPWAFKFVWAPWVDQLYCKKLGKRKTWLLLMQIALVMGILLLAVTQFSYGLGLFIVLGLWISTAAATQDIAIDGYTVETFPTRYYRFGSMAQSIGIAFGSMLGGAVTLGLYQYYGWEIALISLACMVTLSIPIIFLIQEQISIPTDAQQFKHLIRPRRPSLKHALQRVEIRYALGFILCYRAVEAPAIAMLSPMLIDQRWSLSDIGNLMSVIGAVVGLVAALSATFILKKRPAIAVLIGVGWLRSLLYALLGILLLWGWFSVWPLLLGLLIVIILAIRYIAMTALYTYFMQICSKEQAGTDFTVLVCFELLVYFLGSACSGFLVELLGYGIFYLILAIVSVLSLRLSRGIILKNNMNDKIIYK